MSEQSNEYDNPWKMILRKYLPSFMHYKITGQEIWFLVHIEIQAQPQSGFGKRMFVYDYRIFDLYDYEVVSLAVLADNDPNWRPHGFRYGDFGSMTSLEFPYVVEQIASRRGETEYAICNKCGKDRNRKRQTRG